MNSISLIQLTARENISGQIFWLSGLLAVLFLLLLGAMSGISLSYQLRFTDVLSYFLIDLSMLFMATLLGSQLFIKNFTNRGIAELLIPMGHSRQWIVLWRWAGQVLSIAALVLLLFTIRLLAFAMVGEAPERLLEISLLMAGFCFLKTTLAFGLALWLGMLVRPVLALLGTLALMAIGHFSVGFSGIQGLMMDSEMILTPVYLWMLKILKVWNPGNLVLDTIEGKWEIVPQLELGIRLAWGLGANAVALALALLSVAKQEISGHTS